MGIVSSMKRLAIITTVAVTTFVSVCANASLYVVGGTYEGVNPDYGVYTWTVKSGGEAITTTGLAGAIRLTSADGSGPNLVCVCTDIHSELYLGSTYNFSDPKSFNQVGTGSLLTWGAGLGASAQAMQNAAYIFDHNKSKLVGNDVNEKAAVQLAVWAALYNTGSRLTVSDASQRFSVSGGNESGISAANAMLALIPQPDLFHYDGSLIQPLTEQGTVDVYAQELLTYAAVPEPATFVAALALLLPFGVSITRSLRKQG